jgi:dihydrofolate reductase
MKVSIIVAVSSNNAIGKDNQLLWHLPNDMKFFKNATWAMPVIMGRKTFDSLAGKPLNGRLNIVISRQENYTATGATVVHSLQEAIEVAQQNDYKEVFVIGGGEIYKEALQIADKIYLTRVDAAIDGDTYFPPWDKNGWNLIYTDFHSTDAKHIHSYEFQIWEQ